MRRVQAARVFRRRWLLVVVSIWLTAPSVAKAQQPTPTSRPPGPTQSVPGQPGGPPPSRPEGPGSGERPVDSAAFDDAGRRATIFTATEVQLLDQLGAFGSAVPADLRTILDKVDLTATSGRLAQIAAFDAADVENEKAGATLLESTAPPSPDTNEAIRRLSAVDRAALESGTPISLMPETYLKALDDLVNRKGRPLIGGTSQPDGDALAAAINGLAAVSTSTTTTRPTSSISGANPLPSIASVTASTTVVTTSGQAERFPMAILIGIGLGLVLAALAGLAFARRGSSTGKDKDLDELLEVSRRLAGVTSVIEVERAALREALSLVPATAGAFIRRDGDQLDVGFETQPELIVVDSLSDGIVRRVAETGQPVLQVSATEPSLRNLPAALAAVPVVGGGEVIAVLMLVREATNPFVHRDRELLTALAPVTGAAIRSARHSDRLAEATLIDALTGVGNRRRFDTDLADVLAAANGLSTSLIMMDLDHFKQINDTHGHPAGDVVLKGAAQVLRDTVRPHDRVFRYGGEEFCVVLPETSVEEATIAAERIRSALRDARFEAGLDTPLRATASFGVATTTDPDGSNVIERADAAMYDAKSDGRDQVMVARE